MLIKNNKKREAALKNGESGDEKHLFFLLGLINTLHLYHRFVMIDSVDKRFEFKKLGALKLQTVKTKSMKGTIHGLLVQVRHKYSFL